LQVIPGFQETTQSSDGGLGHLETITGNSAAIVADFTRYLATAPVLVSDTALCPDLIEPDDEI